MADRTGRGAALGATLAAAEAVGRVELWLGGAVAAADADRADPAAAYFVGFVLQRAKLLGRADPYLARAAELDPRSPEIRAAYAWNAYYRFDVDAALSRARAGDFPGRDDLLFVRLAEGGSSTGSSALVWTSCALAAAGFAFALRGALRRDRSGTAGVQGAVNFARRRDTL